MELLSWSLGITESGKKSHLTETEAFIFCAPMWGAVTEAIPYEGQTSFKGKPMCKTCDKAGSARASKVIAERHGSGSSSLWLLYQTANGDIRLVGNGKKPVVDETSAPGRR